jgi:hypothetical protein
MYLSTTLDSSVTVIYSGTGTTATVVFKIDTSTAFTKNLNLGCVISENSVTVYSSNTITFTVNACNPIGLNPSINM